MRALTLAAASAVFAAALVVGVSHKPGGGQSASYPSVTFTSATAYTAWGVNHRVARRTARRTTRRLNSLPAGCPLMGLYYYCNGVYYQRMVDSGSTYYIVVTP